MLEPFYRPSFSRHLHSLVVNGFFARDLDADDHEFLEYVKVHGIANGSLPNSSAVLLEELEFWHLPYTIAPNVERRIGRRPRTPETPEQRELRKVLADARQARRVIRENEKAIAEAELEREQQEWEKAAEMRKMRETMSDLEWEMAAPWRKGPPPQWQLDAARVKQAAAERKEKERADKLKRWEAEKQARATARLKNRIIKARARKAAKEEAEQKRREAFIEEARQTLARANQLERERRVHAAGLVFPAETTKWTILTLHNSTPGRAWTCEELARSLGGADEEFVGRCVEELVQEGRLFKTTKRLS
jgi:hypothetical protein